MKQRLFNTLLFIITCMSGLQVQAADTTLYVSPGEEGILQTALRQAREYRRRHDGGTAEIRLSAGIYRLYEALRFHPEDSHLQLTGEEGTVIAGSIQIKGWRKEGKLWVADVPDFNGRPIDFRQLWVNGKKAIRARSVADFEKMPRILNYDKKKQILWVPSRAMKVLKGEVGYTELVLHQMWEIGILRVKSIQTFGDSTAITFHQPEARIQFEHPWPSPMYHSKHDSPFYLVNSLALLDEPGEWYHDIRNHRLYYMPLRGENMMLADVEVPVLETLVELTGRSHRKPSDITFNHITFSYTSWMRPSYQGHVPLQAGMYLTEAYKLRPQIDRKNNHKLDNQGWLGRPEAAIKVYYADSIHFKQCTFSHLGGMGLDYLEGCKGGVTSYSTFTDIALNGYVSGSFSPAGLETHLPYRPDLKDVCEYQEISRSLFTDVANEEWGCLAIAAGYVKNINIEHNEIHDVPYSAISLGWGWNRDSVCMRNNRVHANLIYRYAQHMYDCAGIYTLGNQPGTMITENVVRDIAKPSYVHDPNHWFYLYTDEGSSNITLQDNWTPSDKYLKNAVGPNNQWLNNGPQVSEQIKNRAGR